MVYVGVGARPTVVVDGAHRSVAVEGVGDETVCLRLLDGGGVWRVSPLKNEGKNKITNKKKTRHKRFQKAHSLDT